MATHGGINAEKVLCWKAKMQLQLEQRVARCSNCTQLCMDGSMAPKTDGKQHIAADELEKRMASMAKMNPATAHVHCAAHDL